MSRDMQGKTALISGAARGLGLRIADDLAKKGVNICGTDIRLEQLENGLVEIADAHEVETLALETDVSDDAAVESAVKQVYETWGRIDILVNNAGIRLVGPVPETSTATWDTVLDTNLKGQFLFTREVLKQGMLAQNEGVIIFLSSDAGKQGNRNSSAYSASKFGIFGFAESLARELKTTKIRVTTLAPGRIWTPMAEESEVADLDLDWLDPADVSRAVLFCVDQDPDVIIPELRIYHRAQI